MRVILLAVDLSSGWQFDLIVLLPGVLLAVAVMAVVSHSGTRPRR